MLLDKLNFSVSTLKGIGKNISKILASIGINNVGELLEYFPRKYSDRTRLVSLQESLSLEYATVKVRVIDHRMVGKKYKQFLKILIFDGERYGSLLCFNRDFLKNVLKIDHYYYITGKFIFNFGEIQTSNFEYEEAIEEYKGKIVPIYPLTEGLTQNILRNAISDALNKFRLDIDNELPEYLIIKNMLFAKREALKNIHFPEDFNSYYKAKKSFIYEEFFFQKLFLLNRKDAMSKINKNRKKIEFKFKNEVIKNLPFKLTDYQEKTLQEIEKDLFSNKNFSRLLQGDVGSGKTIIAILSMVSVVEAGEQCVLMAPTEVLAKQHFNTIKKFCSSLWLDIALLTGDLTKKERENILTGLKNGEIKMVVGTHSLFSEDIIYKNLSYVIIDEQHRFGVEQRLQLMKKGERVDLLLMTATPIPQSLALALYGDLDLTIMKGSITGRKPVKTWVIDDDEKRIYKMYEWIKEELRKNGKAIFVYSLIEDSEKMDAKDLMNEFEKLKSIFKEFGVGFIHSKLNSEEKDKIMEDFREGRIKILTATTVVEVGIDVPDANIIVVENAERYGLSTLHQLRGRVGRNNDQGYMILISKLSNLTDEGKKRLEIIKKEIDGFKIAEEDLLLRGPGDFIGSKQSGLPEYKFANIKEDLEILKVACLDAEELFNKDKNLEKKEHLQVKISYLNRLKNFFNNYYER